VAVSLGDGRFHVLILQYKYQLLGKDCAISYRLRCVDDDDDDDNNNNNNM
jgi:hypothetical protein